MNLRVLGALLLALCAALPAWAANVIDPDDLPREEILLPDGSKVYNVRYLNRNWRQTTPDVLLAKRIQDTEDVCFETKFDIVENKAVKLFGQNGQIVCFDESKLKEMKTYMRMDNVWICGKLRPVKEGAGLELVLVDIARLPEDLVLCRNRLSTLEKRKDAEGLLELGHRITKILEQVLRDFNQHEQFMILRSKAWSQGLTLKEQQLAEDDVDGMYALAEKWVELLRKTSKRNELVLRILRRDPEHRKASRVAREELDMVLHEGRWKTKKERDADVAAQLEQVARMDAEKRAALEAKRRQQEAAMRERAQILVKYQIAIRTADGVKELEGAIESLGKAIQNSPDPRFGRQGVEVLASIGDPSAVYPGLDAAAKSEFPEVRRDTFAVLAWRGGENALKTLAHSLRKEWEPAVVRSGVEALVRRGDRPALEALIDCLQAEDRKVQAEVTEGLKSLTRVANPDRDAWLKWWSENKERKDLLPTATP